MRERSEVTSEVGREAVCAAAVRRCLQKYLAPVHNLRLGFPTAQQHNASSTLSRCWGRISRCSRTVHVGVSVGGIREEEINEAAILLLA